MVLPVPNPPGIAHVPPFVIGKRLSITRCPVISGVSHGNFRLIGRGMRSGHVCDSVKIFSLLSGVFIVKISSVAEYSPSNAARVTIPEIFGGSIALYVIKSVSATVAKISPSFKVSPTFAKMLVGNFPSGGFSESPSPSGRMIPSKIPPIIAGRSVTDMGCPVFSTGVFGFSPDVLS